ncbi:MAG TPA: DegV family protein [Chloroflexia bacterium]|nr:DegV family protein [Chloroflexia bacterium]
MATPVKQTVKVVTDSTADMAPEATRRLGVTVVPLMVLMGEETYRDGIDISANDFYQRLPKLSKLPTTSQPSPGAFLKAYEEATAEGYQVISIHLSAKLSGTYENAVVASRNFPEGQVTVFDTQQVSAGIAFFVMTAAEMARNGYTASQIMAELESMKSRVKLIATVDTLEYLYKGGRIGGLKSFLGSLFSVKPILQLKDGEVQPLEQVRTRNKALQRIAELTKAQGPFERLAILHGADPDGAGELANMIAPFYPLKEIYISFVGPVIGTHGGPRTLGVVFQKAKNS